MNHVIKSMILHTTRWIPDELYLQIAYRITTGKTLHLKNPKTYNEKLQWLKLHDRKSEYTQMVDKYEVRRFVAERVGEEYLIPLIGIWNGVDEIDFAALPNQFVLKCTHDSHGVVICKDKGKLDVEKAKKKLNDAMSRNFFYQGREWPYKNVVPRIICEAYMEDSASGQLIDYKVFNFSGVPKLVQVDYDRFTKHKRQFFDEHWNQLPVSFYLSSDETKHLDKPECWSEVIALAQKLSKGFAHLRTDFYIVNGRIYVGEMTFYHGNGMGKWSPESVDLELGKLIDLSMIDGGK